MLAILQTLKNADNLTLDKSLTDNRKPCDTTYHKPSQFKKKHVHPPQPHLNTGYFQQQNYTKKISDK